MVELRTKPSLGYNDPNKCYNLLRLGIVAVKYNRQNGGRKKVLLQLSADMKNIVYEGIDETNKWKKL